MTLGGMAIAIGALVDDAIIDVENVFRRLRENHHLRRASGLALRGVLRGVARDPRVDRLRHAHHHRRLPAALLPGRRRGSALAPLGFAYVVAILASLLVAVTVTPVLCRTCSAEREGGAAGARERRARLAQARVHYARCLDRCSRTRSACSP